MDRFIARYVMVALSVVGSAILLFSCEREEEPESEARIEMMMTEYSENLSVVMSQNGRRSYHSKPRCSKVIRWRASLIANSPRGWR